ncbi:hypothetical protein LTR08_001737 [Meristemomyces frigidus]|nr:hypothetical protein LTR08_001737 [Meristemomyces frigidus]
MAEGWENRMDLAAHRPEQPHLLVDEQAQKTDTEASAASAARRASVSSFSSPASPPASPPAMENQKSPTSAADDYYSSRPKFDRLGNAIPDHRRPGAMASVYGRGKVTLPGDLGAKDPRRPRSPAPLASLPGDLGPNDPRKPRSTHTSPAPVRHAHRGSLDDSEGNARLQEDPPVPGADAQDSDDDADADNDNDTDLDDKRGRGRKRPEPGKTTSGKSTNLRERSVDSDAEFVDGKPDPTKGQSKLSFQARDSSIKITPPTDKKRVHPSTAFDVGGGFSGTSTPAGGSDDESHSELRAAQKLSLTMSAIHSTPSAHRVIRQIIRGDYAHFQREAELGRKRQRMYLVATDLSPESEYALEWTIGTVLRDGDTLFAVFANDEESASGSEKGGGGVDIGHGADSVRDTSAIISGLPATNVPPTSSAGPSPLARNVPADSRSRSKGVYSSSADLERRRAAEDITQRCIALLRKTRLQVRVVVEVFHCKSPRHMITEVIDFLSPTLVIIGSRGRSAVKGVLLGSFSNYLVTKSSVPVMVARKKLRKHGKGDLKEKRNRDGTTVPYSGSGRTGRLSNVIEGPRGKGLRVKGWGEVGID